MGKIQKSKNIPMNRGEITKGFYFFRSFTKKF